MLHIFDVDLTAAIRLRERYYDISRMKSKYYPSVRSQAIEIPAVPYGAAPDICEPHYGTQYYLIRPGFIQYVRYLFSIGERVALWTGSPMPNAVHRMAAAILPGGNFDWIRVRTVGSPWAFIMTNPNLNFDCTPPSEIYEWERKLTHIPKYFPAYHVEDLVLYDDFEKNWQLNSDRPNQIVRVPKYDPPDDYDTDTFWFHYAKEKYGVDLDPICHLVPGFAKVPEEVVNRSKRRSIDLTRTLSSDSVLEEEIAEEPVPNFSPEIGGDPRVIGSDQWLYSVGLLCPRGGES